MGAGRRPGAVNCFDAGGPDDGRGWRDAGGGADVVCILVAVVLAVAAPSEERAPGDT